MGFDERIYKLLGSMSSTEASHFEALLGLLGDLVLATERGSQEREKLFIEINKYLKRKKTTPTLTDERDEIEYLRHVRNSLAHRSAIANEAVRVAMPMFWRLLKKTAEEWHWSELSHLLSYSLREDDANGAISASTPKTQLRKYEERFNRLPDEVRDMVFRDLLLSIFATSEFQRILKRSRTNRTGASNV